MARQPAFSPLCSGLVNRVFGQGMGFYPQEPRCLGQVLNSVGVLL